MAKLKDGFYKQTAEAVGSDSYMLLAGGGSKALSDFATASGVVTALGTNGNYVTWTKNGTANNLTVPYATNADKVDGYHASSFWRSDGATWNPTANITMTPTSNGQEWSFDFRNKGSYTGSYWHVWDESKNTLLRVDADSGAVSAPYGFVGNLTGNATTATEARTLCTDATMKLYAEKNNEVNFGGTNTSSTIYFGLRATDSKSVPTKFVFGSNTGTASLVAKQAILSSTVESNRYNLRYNGTEGLYGYLLISTRGTACTTEGTAGTTGITLLSLGNDKAVSTTKDAGAENAQGILRLYGTNTGFVNIRCGTHTTNNYNLYLPGDDGQFVYHTNDTAIGGSTTPVYVTSGGKVTACTSYAKAIKSITRSGTTFTYTCIDGTTGTFTQQDNNTTYSAGTGISLSGTTFSNAGVRSTTINGNYLRVNTNGTNADLTIPYATNANTAKHLTHTGGNTGSDKSLGLWFQVGELVIVDKAQTNNNALFYVTDYYQRRTFGILRIEIRCETNATKPARVLPQWLVNNGFALDNLQVSYGTENRVINSVTKSVIVLKIYIKAHDGNYSAVKLVRISDGGWNTESTDQWTLVSNRLTALPGSETFTQSTNAVITNNIDWSNILNKPDVDQFVTLNTAQTISGVKTFSTQQKFTVAKGTSPFTVSSTTKVDNLNADLLDGLHSTDFVRQYGIVGANFSTGNWLGYTYATEEHGSPVAGGVISAGVSSGMQLVGSYAGTGLYYRGVDDGAFSDWKRVAFTDSNITGNAATADKLKTKRKLWGQNFDGSADVNGNIKMGSSGAGLHYQAKSGDWSYFPFFLHNAADSAVLFRATFVGKDESLSYFSLGPTLSSFTITNKSLVGIGTASPTEKLHVNGLVNIEANSGILTIGCQNTSYTHYSTTGGTHWFNKAVEVNGSLTPHANVSFNIGSTSKRWSTIYGVNGNFSGTIKMYTGDSALAIYSGRITDAKSDGNICFQTSIDNTDPQSHAHPTQHGGRCNIVLQPRGGQVYIGTNPDEGDATYKLYVNGRTFSKELNIDSGNDAKIVLNNTDAETKYQYISFSQDGTQYGSLGTFGDDVLKWSGYPILHTGNSSISDYNVKINGTTKQFVRDWGHGAANMNDVARGGRSSVGMADLSTPSGGTATAVNPNGGTSWHHFINISYRDGGAGSNSWVTQIANKAGTTDLWVRSRNGGTISDTTNWAAGWTRILTGTNYTNYINTTNFPGLNKTGTVTQVKIGSTAYNPSSGIVSLPAYPTSLPANGGNADTVDGYHAGLANGSVAIYVPFPTYTTLKTGGYISSSYGADEYGHPDSEFLQGICKWAIATYPNKGDITLIGSVAPNSSGTCILHLYSSSGKDSTTKLPRYCRGQYMSLNGQLFQFGTSNYNWSYERFANLSDITGHYWANIKISSSSNEATTPTFSTIATTGVSYVATLRPSTTETHYLGSANNRWNGVFSKSGNFSGQITLSVATGTAPFKITSTTVNTNLNADMVDGKHASDFATSGHTHSYLPLSGGTMTGNIKVYTDGDGRGLKFGTSTLNSLSNQLLWQSAEAIRFGSSSWDWDAWAGLKYKHSSKIIYLGLADGTIFNANTAQSGGKLYLPGISEVYTGNGTNKVWHAGNDGHGSGLDADTLDGYHIWTGTRTQYNSATKNNNTIYLIYS